MRRLADYWLKMRGDRKLPSVTDVDPVDIPWALSRVFLLETADVPGGWRVRLAGAEIERGFDRRTLKDVPLAELFDPESYPHVRDRLDECLSGPSIIYMHGQIYRASNRLPVGGRLHLPLAHPVSGEVCSVLGMTDWSNWPSTDQKADDVLEVYAIDPNELK